MKFKARSISKLATAGPLKGIDLACRYMDDAKPGSMCADVRDGCETRFNAQHVKASSAGEMNGNRFAAGDSSSETIDQIGKRHITPITMHKTNMRVHNLAVIGRHAGMSPVKAALASAEKNRRETDE